MVKASGIASGKWLQCNQADVDFESDVEDQFTHNFEDCEAEAIREDGNGIYDMTSNVSISSTGLDSEKCNGTLSGIQHGRQKVTLRPADSCDKGTTTDIVWDTDLPGTFSPQDFSSTEYWFKNTSSPRYAISTKVPATGAGTFPKHYTVDCFEEYWSNSGGSKRPDGNGRGISCILTTAKTDIDDGCNPHKMGADYWHVCGGSKQNKQTKWAVYAPETESCANVQCEPELICCDNHSDRSCTADICYAQVNNPRCTNPKGGSSQDSSSGCSDLGLYNCTYSLPCDGTSPFSQTGSTSYCSGKRQNDSCSFPVSGTCTPNVGVGVHENSVSSAGTCSFPGTSWTKSCTASVSSFCDSGHHETRTRNVCVGGNVSYDCNCRNVCTGPLNNRVCNQVCSTCTRWDSCATTRQESYQVWVCDDYDYRASATSCSQTVSGTCGTPSGGCSRKGVGGGNLTQEMCEVDKINKTRMPADCDLTGCSRSPVNGQCDTTHYDCITGSSQNAREERGKWTWKCAGINGGTTASCEEPKPVACGSPDSIDCSNIAANNSACRVGTPENCTDTSSAWTWDCKNGTQTTN